MDNTLPEFHNLRTEYREHLLWRCVNPQHFDPTLSSVCVSCRDEYDNAEVASGAIDRCSKCNGSVHTETHKGSCLSSFLVSGPGDDVTQTRLCWWCKQDPKAAVCLCPNCLTALKDAACEVKISAIPNSGMGLFTLRDLSKGHTISEFEGQLFAKELLDHGSGYHQQYHLEMPLDVIDLSKDLLLHAGEPEGVGRFANMCRDQDRTETIQGNNCFIHLHGTRAFLVTTKAVKANQELFCDYGPTYWNTPPPTTNELSTVHLDLLPLLSHSTATIAENAAKIDQLCSVVQRPKYFNDELLDRGSWAKKHDVVNELKQSRILPVYHKDGFQLLRLSTGQLTAFQQSVDLIVAHARARGKTQDWGHGGYMSRKLFKVSFGVNAWTRYSQASRDDIEGGVTPEKLALLAAKDVTQADSADNWKGFCWA